MQWNLLYNVPFECYMVNFKGGSFFLCSVYHVNVVFSFFIDATYTGKSFLEDALIIILLLWLFVIIILHL